MAAVFRFLFGGGEKKSGQIQQQPAPGATTPTMAQMVDPGTNQTTTAQNAGRAALISTSPTGVQGMDPTGRRRLFGN